MIRLWSSGALLTTDLMFSIPKVRLFDGDGPGLTSTPPIIRSNSMLRFNRIRGVVAIYLASQARDPGIDSHQHQKDS